MGTASSRSRRDPRKPDASRRVTEVDRQVLGLKTQRRKLNAYAARVATQITRETANAAALAKTGERSRCLHALRRRKLHEKNAARIDEWATSVETLLSSIEQAQATAVVLERLRLGAKALKEAQKGHGVEDVHETLREMETGAERQAEVDAALADQLDADAENAALAELAELEMETNAKKETVDREKTKKTVDGVTNSHEQQVSVDHGDHGPRSVKDVAAALPSAPASAPARRETIETIETIEDEDEEEEPSREPSRVAAS
mgnify:CR=1 FL=1